MKSSDASTGAIGLGQSTRSREVIEWIRMTMKSDKHQVNNKIGNSIARLQSSQEMQKMKGIKIDGEFRDQLPRMTEDERNTLRESIRCDGCRDPVIVWKGEGSIVDGHNRYDICTELDVQYEVREMDFSDRDAVSAFIDTTQLGRRNVTSDQMKMLIGRIYQRRRQAHGGQKPKKGMDQSEPSVNTAEEVARENGLSSAFVKRSSALVDEMEKDRGLKDAILDGKSASRYKKEQKCVEEGGPAPLPGGMERARKAISELNRIPEVDTERMTAIRCVHEWTSARLPNAVSPAEAPCDPSDELFSASLNLPIESDHDDLPYMDGLIHANEAIDALRSIDPGDTYRTQAFDQVSKWIQDNR